MRTCQIEGCNNKHKAKGFCQSHYDQSRGRHHTNRKVTPFLFSEDVYEKKLIGLDLNRTSRNSRKRKIDALAMYGERCNCCKEEHFEFLALDHIDGNGNAKRKQGQPQGEALYRYLAQRGYPKGEFRVLCHNCNQSIGNFGYCPHKGLE